MVVESNIIHVFADELLSQLPKDWQEFFLSLTEEEIQCIPCVGKRRSLLEGIRKRTEERKMGEEKHEGSKEHRTIPVSLQEFFDSADSLTMPYEVEASR